MSIPVLLALVVAIEVGLHYFPWHKARLGKELPRPAAYALGVAGMMIPFTVWVLETSQLKVAFVLWYTIVAAGLAVFVCYGIDWVLDLLWKEREARQREQLLKDIIDGKG